MKKERIYSLDVLRGFSLFGIILMNIVGFSHDTFHVNPYYMFQKHLDSILYSLDVIFVHNSFYPIFAMLFGYGYAIMFDNSRNRGQNFLPIGYRRLIAMLIFGIIHGMFIFSGDILQSYAIVGLLLIPFLYWNKMFSIIAAGLLWIYYFVMYQLPLLMYVMVNPNMDYKGSSTIMAERSAAVFNSGNILEIIGLTTHNFYEYFFVTDFDGLMFRVSSLGPLILMGMVLYRYQIFQSIVRRKEVCYPIGAVLVVIGIMVKSLPTIFWGRMSLDAICVYWGGITLAAGYMTFIVLLSDLSRFRKITQPIARLGQMSFTVYITQSVMMFAVVYGFKLFGKMNLLETYSLAVGIYIILLGASVMYFKKYKQGPLEYIWRRITYLK